MNDRSCPGQETTVCGGEVHQEAKRVSPPIPPLSLSVMSDPINPPSLPSLQVTMLIRTLHACTTDASHCRLRKGPIQSRRKLTIFLFCGRPVTRNATTQGVSLLHAEREGKERGLYHTTDIENAINGSRVTSFLLLFITQNGSEHDRNL